MSFSKNNTIQTSKDLSPLLIRAFRYLSFRSRSKKEVFDKLREFSQKSQFSEADIQSVITTLEENKYINDRNLIAEVVDSYSRNKPKGRAALKFILLKKGVPNELINEFFDNTEVDELGLAIKALGKKWPQFSHLDNQKKIMKTTAFLRRRGFGYEIVKKAIEELDKKE